MTETKKFQQKLPKDIFEKANLTQSLDASYTLVSSPVNTQEGGMLHGLTYQEAASSLRGITSKPDDEPARFVINSSTQGMRFNR